MAHAGGFDLRPGDLFNERYEVVRPLSVGGMGAVYEAVHVETRRRRALKLMLPGLLGDASARARFKLEAQVAANIESEHIVEVVDAGVDARTGAPFIVMELLRGEDLGAVLSKRRRLPASDAVDMLAQAARALDATHAAGIVHRDLKPENLFLTIRADGSSRVKVLDFGIAKVLQESRHQTRATASIGTPVFMAPEQISGAGIGPAADVYALGQIAYTLLCGSAYWDVEAGALNVYSLLVRVAAGAREPAVVRAARAGVTLPAAFEEWFARATALAPADWFPSAGELVVALAGALGVPAPAMPRPVPMSLAGGAGVSSGGGAVHTAYGATVPLGTRPRRRGRWSLFAGAAVLAFAGLAAGAARFLVVPGPSGETGMLAQPGTVGPAEGLSGTPAASAPPQPRVEPAPQGSTTAAPGGTVPTPVLHPAAPAPTAKPSSASSAPRPSKSAPAAAPGPSSPSAPGPSPLLTR